MIDYRRERQSYARSEGGDEGGCNIHWLLAYSVATPAGVNHIRLTLTLPVDDRGGYLY